MIKICTKVNPNFLLFFKSHPRLALVFGQNIHIYNSETGDLIKILFQHKNNIRLIQEDGNNFIALDKNGLLTVWNSEHLYLISEKQFPREVTTACVSSNSETMYYTNIKEKTLFKVSLLGLNASWEYTEELFPKAQTNGTGMYKLKMSVNNQFLIECGEQEVYVHDVQSQTLVNKIKHPTRITALEIHPMNDSVIVGDRNGRIFFYHGAFVPKNKVVSSSMHWHSHAVKTLCITPDGTQLLSGGEEGVIVFWHLTTNKRTFCPRLGSAIISLQIDPTRTSAAALLGSNTLKIIKMSTFEEIGSIGSITNPADFSHNKGFLEDVWSKGLKVHPKTSNLCLQSLPGQIQLFDVWNFQRVRDIQITDRNFVSRTDEEYPSPVQAGLFAFSNDGRYLASVEQRYSKKDNFFLCTLKFWIEDGLNNYQVNTLVEHPHGLLQVKDIVYIELQNNTPLFATVGEDNIIKLWGKREKKQPAASSTSTAHKTYVWGPLGEITYKKLDINKVKYAEKLGSDNNEILLFAAENNLVLWDIKNYKPLFVVSTGDEKIQDFEVCKDKVVVSTGQKLWIFDLNSWSFTHQIPLLSITKLVYNITHDFLYILARLEGKSVILLLSMETYTILKAVILKDQIRSLVIVRPPNEIQARAILFCEDCSIYVFDEDIKDNLTENFDRSGGEGLKKREDLEASSRRGAQKTKVEKLVLRDQEALTANMLNFFPQKTHLLPPISLIYKPLIERFLTKVGEIQNESREDKNAKEAYKGEMEIDIEDTENTGEETMDDLIKKFSTNIQAIYSGKESNE